MKNVLISSILIFFSFCTAQKKNLHDDSYNVSLENQKCFDQVTLKNKLLNDKFLLIWDGKDCDNTIRSYIESVDYKNDTITLNIWMGNVDELRMKIIAKNEKPYIYELYNKTHYFDKDKECTYSLNYVLLEKNNLSPIIYQWINENKCN